MSMVLAIARPKGRQATILMKYENKDISAEIAPDIESFRYTDAAASQSDSVSITVNAKADKWKNDWMPEKGVKLYPTIVVKDWNIGGVSSGYRDYSAECGAYRKFDANAKELTDHVDGKHILEAKSLEIKVGGATVTISESGAVTVNSPAGITIKAAGTLELSASTITASAGMVNITGGGGDVVVSGKSLVNHTHTGNLGNQTSPPT